MPATYQDCQTAFRKHPREVSMLSAAEDAFSVWKDDQEWSLAALWAIDAARRFTRGEADVEECQMAAGAAGAAVDAAYAADAADAAAYAAAYAAADAAYAAAAAYAAWAAWAAADADAAGNAAWAAWAAADADAAGNAAWAAAAAAYGNAISRLPSIAGSWGVWRETPMCSGFGMAGDYFWRDSEGRFLDRGELTEQELVAMDSLMEAA